MVTRGLISLLVLVTAPALAQAPPAPNVPPASSAPPVAPAPPLPAQPPPPAQPQPPPQPVPTASADSLAATDDTSSADPPPLTKQETRASKVHTGTFLRFHLGYAYMVADFSPYDPMGGSNFGFSIGGTLTRGLALAGLLDFASGGDEEGIFMGQFGLALNYYFMPVNMYAGLSVGYASGGYDDPSTDVADALEVETDGAFSYTVSVGYEYLFKDSAWGLGPAVRFWQVALDDGRFSATCIVLSATNH